MIHQGFSKAWYGNAPYLQMWYRGIPIVKCPLDLWSYHEIIWQTRPDLIIETGTFAGGSAVWLADQLDMMVAHEGLRDDARVVTVEIRPDPDGFPEHDRVTYVVGWPSTDLRAIEAVKEHVAKHERVMVLLDSDHSKTNVLRELNAYAPFVTHGCYLIVEDTNEDAYSAMEAQGYSRADGFASHAVKEWRPAKHGFIVDERRERFLFSQNPAGYLKKTGKDVVGSGR